MMIWCLSACGRYKERQYCVGLSARGQDAIKRVEGLWEKVEKCGMPTSQFVLHAGKRAIALKRNPGKPSLLINQRALAATLVQELETRHSKKQLQVGFLLHLKESSSSFPPFCSFLNPGIRPSWELGASWRRRNLIYCPSPIFKRFINRKQTRDPWHYTSELPWPHGSSANFISLHLSCVAKGMLHVDRENDSQGG